MMFEMVLPACQTAMRVGFSSLLYHEDVTEVMGLVSIIRRWRESHTLGNAGEEGSLAEANDKSNSTETSTTCHIVSKYACRRDSGENRLFHGRHANGSSAPCKHNDGQKCAGVGFRKPQVAGKLSNQISDVESTNACVPGGVAHLQIVLETGETSIGDVDAIKVASGG